MIGSHERLKKAWEGGKESRIMEEECGVETMIWESRLEATRADWMNLMAETRIGAAFERVVRTSDPTAMAVMLVAGTCARILRVTQLAAVAFDWPMPSSWSLGTETVTLIPVLASASSMALSVS